MRCTFSVAAMLVAASTVQAAPLSFRDLFDPNAGEPIHAVHGVLPEPETESGRDRIANFDVEHYDLTLAIEPVSGVIGGVAKVQFVSKIDGLSQIVLDAVDLAVDDVTDGSSTLEATTARSLLAIRLARPLAKGDHGYVAIRYTALRSQNFFVAGPDATNPGHMPAAYTYTEPEGSSAWFPCLDRPEDKATTSVKITVPDGFKALTNGDLVSQKKIGRSDSFEYRMEFPVATYLISLAIGPFEVLDIGQHGDKKLTVWAPPAIAAAARFETARTARMMEDFAEFTGFEYPFNNYAQSVAEAYKTSMEHESATTMGGWRITGDGSGEGVVAHELAHQWFGDWVTCRTWGELWLNEGFASYLPYVFFAKEMETVRAIGQIDYFRSGYFEEAADRVHALSEANPDMDNLFDSHAYEKGALVIHFLRSVAGDAAFTAALKDYLTTNGGGNGTSQDLQASLERATGTSWQLIFDQWVRSAGHPVLAVTPTFRDTGIVSLAISQVQATRIERQWRSFTMPVEVEVINADGTVSHTSLDLFENELAVDLPSDAAQPVAVVLDPRWVLLAEITIQQSAEAWQAVLRHAEEETARITALRELFTHNQIVSQELFDVVRADPSTYLQITALELWSTNSENRGLIAALYQQLSAQRDSDIATRGSLARTEQWLVSTTGQAPSRDEERRWQDRFLATPVVAEKKALLGMLTTASAERAQAFAAERIAEARWVTQDRSSLIDTLTKAPTSAAESFIAQALEGSAPVFLRQILTNLVAAGYDRPAIVEAVTRNAQAHRYDGVRAGMVQLLGKQVSRKDQVCPVLEGLLSDAVVGEVAAASKSQLHCGE